MAKGKVEITVPEAKDLPKKPKKKRLTKKRVIWGVVILVIIAGIVYFVMSSGGDDIEIVTDTVRRQKLVQTVEVTGELETIDKVELSFEIGGTVEGISVAVGDQIEAGALLLRLDSRELAANVETARRQLDSAQAKLDQKYAGSTNEAIQVAEASNNGAEASLLLAKADQKRAEDDLVNTKSLQAETVADAVITVATAMDTRQHTLTENAEDLLQAQEDIVNTLTSAMIAVRSALSDADEVLGIDNKPANDDFGQFLAANNIQSLSDAKNSYEDAKDFRDRAEDVIFDLKRTSPSTDINAAVPLAEAALRETAKTLLYTRRALDGTNIATNDFSSADLSTLKATIDIGRNEIQTGQEEIVTGTQKLSSVIIQNETSADSVENSLSSAEQALSTAGATEQAKNDLALAAVNASDATVALREADLMRTGAQLREATANPRGVDVASLQADVARTLSDLDAAEARLARAQMISPIDGHVTSIDVEVGEQVSAATRVVTVQTTNDQYRIVAKVPESDIAKITLGNKTEITFDAFGDDSIYTGDVRQIDPAEQVIEGVVFYEIEVYLDAETSIFGFKPGMTADITIMTQEVEGIISVPQRAVLQRDGRKYVRIPDGDGFEERTVKTGLRGDGGKLEIIEGLKEGETIIITIRD